MKKALVLEGGGLRGSFTSGVLECLLENKYFFDHLVGVSAGACVGVSYTSRQKGRNWKVNVEMPSSPQYVGVKNFLTTGSFFNMKFIFDEIPNKIVPFDYEQFYKSAEKFEIGVTSRKTGKIVYFDKGKVKGVGLTPVLQASSSIPLLSPSVKINNEYYYDGGVANSIPIDRVLDSYPKIMVILTRPRGYRKEKSKMSKFVGAKYRKYPQFAEALINRWKNYNASLALIDELEKKNKVYVIAPEEQYIVDRMEKNKGKLAALYQHGYNMCQKEYENIRNFFR